jgi:hypothetical protein
MGVGRCVTPLAEGHLRVYGEERRRLSGADGASGEGAEMSKLSRRLAIGLAVVMSTALLAVPALAQETVELDDTILDYTEVGEVEEEPEVLDVVIDRGRPAVPTEVLGVQERLAITGGDLAVLAGLAALLLALGTVAIRSGRGTTARR